MSRERERGGGEGKSERKRDGETGKINRESAQTQGERKQRDR